jgi:hypothetical protein
MPPCHTITEHQVERYRATRLRNSRLQGCFSLKKYFSGFGTFNAALCSQLQECYMPMHRSGFSEFLHQRRVALGGRWKQILSDAYLSRATLHRIRHGDPYHPIAEVDSLRSLANALRFDTWADLVAAFDAKSPAAGIDAADGTRPAPMSPRQPPAPREDALVSLSQALNLSPTELVRRLALGAMPGSEDRGAMGQGDRGTGGRRDEAQRHGDDEPVDGANGGPVRGVSLSASLPTSLRTKEKRPARLVPHFLSGVAASRRVEKLEEEDFDSRQPVDVEDARVFTIPVDGDCQEPAWKDGEIVLFSFDAYDREGILPGKSYYLAFTDGTTTFKRVYVDEDDTNIFILRCWNTDKYPAERRVHFSEVVRVARAISKQVTPEE